MSKSVALSLIAVVILAGAGFLIFKPSQSAVVENPISSSTNNPNPIPISPEPIVPIKVPVGFVSGHVTIGPICPVERVGQPCIVPAEAYTSREAVVYASDSTTVKARMHLDAQGDYKITLAPGNYFVQIVPAGIGAGEKKPASVKIMQTTVVNFDIDTGIR
jgi:hypothetical protein